MFEGLNLVETVLVIDSCAQGMSVSEICSTYNLDAAAVRKAVKARGQRIVRKHAAKAVSKTESLMDSAEPRDLGGRPVSAKTMFVAGLPGGLPVTEVVERADKAGLVLSANHIRKIRARANTAPVLQAQLLDEHKESVVALIADDRTPNYIARKFGVTHRTVTSALKRWGVPAPERVDGDLVTKSAAAEVAALMEARFQEKLASDKAPDSSSGESGVVGQTARVPGWLRVGVVLRKRADHQVDGGVLEGSV